MSYSRKIIYHAIIFAIFITLDSFVFATENIKNESVIIFNTTCTRCHEGECSGRMTFHLPKSKADQHIRRHGGELSIETSRQLFRILRYMKEECSFYPLSVDHAKDRFWGSNMLDKLHSPSNLAYFVPLGFLKPGLYELLLDGLNEKSNYCIEIINSEFDYYDTEKVNNENKKISLQFEADVHLEYYFRIISKKTITLKRIQLISQ